MASRNSVIQYAALVHRIPKRYPFRQTDGGSKSLPRLSLLTLAILASGAVHAQISDSKLPQLGEVTVSAEREQNGSAADGYVAKKTTGIGAWGERELHDTPYSMSVMSSEFIENANAKDMDQLFKMNPNTQETAKIASDATDAPWVTIRGFRVTNPIVNGIPLATRTAGVPVMQDIERVEVFNGATGFLYGGGRVGGAVNYITKKPTLAPLRNISFGTYGGSTYFGHVDLGGQFDANNIIGYRLNAVYQDGKTSRKEDKETKAASLALDFKPSDNFYMDLRLSHKSTEAPGPNIFWSPSATNEQIDRSRRGIDRNRSFTPAWLKQNFKSNKFESTTRWGINDIFSLRAGMFYEKVAKDGGDARMRYFNNTVLSRSWFGNYPYQENENLGSMGYLDSKFKTLGLDHILTVGFSSTDNKVMNTASRSRSFATTQDMSLADFANYPRPAEWGQVGAGQPLKRGSKTTYRNIVIGDDIKFNAQWSALLGVNYATTISKNYRNFSSYDKSAITPTLSLIYKPFDRLSTYATYIESLEAGTVVGSTYQNEGQILDPYKSKQYELGTKFKLNDRAIVNMALFRIEKANSFELNTTPKPTLSQDGKQLHQGIELGCTGKLTENLTLITGGTLMDLSIDKATNPALVGKKPTGAANKLAKIFAEYRVPGVSGLTLSGGAYYTGKKYDNNSNTDVVPAYAVFDAGVRYAAQLGSYQTTFNFSIQNITDKVYWSNTAALGDPRTFTFTVKTYGNPPANPAP